MDIARLKILFIILLFIFAFADKGHAQEDKKLYSLGVKAARSGNIDSAFMNFHMLLNAFPKSKFAEDSLFATGEYYFLTANDYDTFGAFSRFIEHYPQAEANLFALAYLLETARRQGEKEIAEKLEKEIMTSRQITLLFRESKEYKYTSPFSRKHKAVYFIDRVEFYINETLFTKASY